MKRTFSQRIFFTVVAIILLLTSVFSVDIISVFADDRLFHDDFSSTSLANWKSASVGTVKSGVYYLKNKDANVIASLGSQKELLISADVSVNVGADEKGNMQNSIASLVVNGNSDLTKGYEFGIGVTKLGTTYARLYLRGNEDVSRILVQKSSDIAGVSGGKISTGKSYKLAMGVYEGKINCFINDALVCSFEDTVFTSGYYGIKTSCASAAFDNVEVKRIPKKKVATIALKNTPATVSRLGVLDFDVLVTYTDSFHTPETIKSDDSRISISGFSRTVGKKNVKVTCDGKSASFDLTVTDSLGDQLVFSDDFSNYKEKNYSIYKTKKEDYNVTYGFSAGAGKLNADIPSFPATFDNALIAKNTIATDITKDIGNSYYFSADAVIYSDVLGTPTKRNTLAEISAFIDDNGAVYKFRLLSTGTFEFSCDSDRIFAKSMPSVMGEDFVLGKTYNLKMTVSENIIICSCNNKDIFFYTGASMKHFSPKMYVNVSNGKGSFDNLKLYKTEQCSPDAAKSIKVYSTADNSVVKEYTGKMIDISKLYLSVTYVDGSTRKVGITENMLKNYDSSLNASQQVTVKYGNATAQINFVYSKYLFYDNFDSGISPTWNITGAANTTLGTQNNKLKTNWNGENTAASISMYTDVEGSTDWRNYSVSADLFFDTTMTKMIRSGQMYSLYFRRTGTTYYDLRFITRGGAISISLYRYVKGTSDLVASITAAQMNAKLATKKKSATDIVKTVGNGVSVNLKALCKDNTVYVFIDDVLLTTFVDTKDDAPYQGYAGMKLAKVSGSVDNFIVEEKGPFNIKKVNIQGVENNTFELYEGFEINPSEYKLECLDEDGTVFYETLTADKISPYDNLQVGKQNITITAYGKKQSAWVVVKQRNDFISKLDSDLKDINPSKLKLSDKEKVYDLANRYDELSGYEITKLSDKSVKNMEKARNKMETLVYPEIKKSKIIYSNDFNEEEDKVESDWYGCIEKNHGLWSFSNGTCFVDQESYNLASSSSAIRVLKPLYAKIDSISARMQMLSDSMYMGFIFNIGESGYYITRLKMDVYDQEGKVNPILQFIKDDDRLFTEYLTGYGVNVKKGDWFNLEVTFVDNVIKVYVNDTLIVSFDDSESVNFYQEGRQGIRLSGGNAKFDNLVIRGTEVEEPVSKMKVVPTEYKDDFEDETAGKDPSHWVEDTSADNFKVVSGKNSKYYGTSYKGGYTSTWLHVFEINPTVNLRFMTDGNNSNGCFGFITRMAPETAYIKIGYDFAKSKWYAVDTDGERDCDINTVYSEKTYKLEKSKWHDLEIVEEGKNVTVKVDGDTVIKLDNAAHDQYGRVGIFADGASVYIDDVKIKFPNGDTVQDGLLEYTVGTTYGGLGEIEKLDGNKMISIGYGTKDYVALSEDNGKTFKMLSEGNQYYDNLKGNLAYVSSIKLHDGSYIFTRSKDFKVYKSTDYAKTFKQIGEVFPDSYLLDELNRRNVTFHFNSFSEYQLKDGTWRLFVCVVKSLFSSTLTASVTSHYIEVYYSDDGGKIWNKSKNDTRDISLTWKEDDVKSADWAETKIVQCTDGTLRMYYSRSGYGCMQYTESKDGGITWEGQYALPEFQCAKSSFSVIKDASKKGTYYLVWVNNNPVVAGSNFSRSRLSLARSTDGKKWTFLCDLERMPEEIYGNDMASSTPLFQNIDPGILVTDDYVYVVWARSDGTDPDKLTGSSTNYHQGLRPRIVRIEKDKLTERAWDKTSTSDVLFPKSIEITKPIKVRYGLGDIFGYSGGTATVTAIDGSKKTIPTERLNLVEEPDMMMLGKQTVVLFDSHCISTSYEIEVVPKYMVNWTVTGNGDVDPQDVSVLEGDSLTAKLTPKSIFYKVKNVTVNGKKVSPILNKLVISNVKEDLDITVVFASRGVLDYLILIIVLFVVIDVLVLAVLSIIKKRNYFKIEILAIAGFFKKVFKKKGK